MVNYPRGQHRPLPAVKLKKAAKKAGPKVSESARQAAGKDILLSCGYVVREVGKFRTKAKCPNKECGHVFWPTGGYGNDTGVPDMLVTCPRWPARSWTVLEWKTETTERRPEQIELVQAGHSVFVESDVEAVQAILAFEERIGVAADPRMLAFIQEYL